MTEELKKEIAEKLCDIGSSRTMSGNYHIDFEEVAEMFEISVEEVKENKEYIADYINSDPRILSETWVEEDFDMMFEGGED